MKTKFSRFTNVAIGVLFSVILTCAMFSVTSYAENVGACSGRITGITTSTSQNPNAGKTSFDSHPALAGAIGAYGVGVDLSIAGFAEDGFAPADTNYAACVSETTASTVEKNLKKYRFEGYAWNDNLGFFSFYCKNKANSVPSSVVNCGDFDYGVEIGTADGSGVRKLTGYGWNESFGYINFSCQDGVDGLGGACGGINYGVSMDASGNLSGHAWSEAQIWIPFSGASIRLPDKALVQEGKLVEGTSGNAVGNWCNSGVKLNVCVEVAPDPMYMVGANFDTETRVADGEDGYDVHVFLKNADGTPINIDQVDPAKDFSLKFTWDDTVKMRQLATSPSSLPDAVVNPLENGVTVTRSNFSDNSSSLFTQFETGHYVSKAKIVSYAPTTNANISYTTSTRPRVPVENSTFLTPLSDSVTAVSRNDLILQRIDFTMNGSSGVIYPEGKASGVSFKFRPAIEVNTLYANDLQDAINAFRNIPVNFVVGAREVISQAAKAARDARENQGNQNEENFKNFSIDLNLDYSIAQTRTDCPDSPNDFKFEFLSSSDQQVDKKKYTLDQEDLDAGIEKNLTAVASLDETGNCDAVAGPSLYSTVNYKLPNGEQTIQYYSNKLPRITTSIVNPAAVVHGNIYAPKAFSPSVSTKTQTTGSISIESVRNSIYENIKKLIPARYITENQDCSILSLPTAGSPALDGCDNVRPYVINGENILYFKNSNIHLALEDGGNVFGGKWLVIIEGGNLYIDADIYNSPTDTARFSAVVLKQYNETCNKNNIYVDAGVKDVYANVVTDCSVFSYDKSLSETKSIDPIDTDTGFPNWGEGSDSFATRIDSLGKQLYWKGSIASRNTIGGADLDAQGSKYLLLGTGETVSTTASTFGFADRLKAQIYDLNYLRTFKADIELAENRWPVDQACGRALSIEDMIAIAEWQASRDRNNPPVIGGDGRVCNGIDPTKLYSLGDPTGDLIPPKDEDHLSKSLSGHSAYDPVYVFYRAPESFIFAKGGKVGN